MGSAMSALRQPVRYLKQHLWRQTAQVAVSSVNADCSSRIPKASTTHSSILDAYSKSYPTTKNALDLFRGEWASKLPGDLSAYSAGQVPLFADDRIAEGLAEVGGVAGQDILELGPLEGGHSYMLERGGAKSILSIEANSRAYLKCLIIKELLGLQRVRFLHGDFMEFLRYDPPSFDLVLASGVLYHQLEPVELIYLLAQVTNRVVVWTHYFDSAIVHASPLLSPKFPGSQQREYKGFRHTAHRQEYQVSLAHPSFCGGSADYSCWLERDELLQAFRYFGFNHIAILREDPHFPNGPCLLFTARKI